MANDPNTIQYVIQEDGFWYIASKDRTPGVPGITVSSKGIANGLSTEYNDGYDFGPDSYNPSVTSGVPLTQTSGIQEAVNYAEATAESGNKPLVMFAGDGSIPFSINSEIQITTTSGITLKCGARMGISIVPSSSFSDSYLFNLSNASITFENITFQNGTSKIGYLENTNATNGFDYHFHNCYFGASPFNMVNFNNEASNSRYEFIDCQFALSGTGTFGTLGSNGDFPEATALFVGCDFGVPNGSSGFTIGAISVLMSANYQHLNPGASTTLTVTPAFVLGSSPNIPIFAVYGHSFMDNYSYLINAPSSTPKGAISTLSIYGINNNGVLTIGSYVFATHISTDSVHLFTDTNLNTLYANADINGASLPSTVTGTTAGSFIASMPQALPTYKKVIIYLDGYENDSTTAQTYTFPVAFSTVAVITNNSASVPGVSTSLTEFSIAPDTTTAYTGIIVIEGY